MPEQLPDDSVNTVVIGGGQAGLAPGYQLRSRRIDHVILDEHDNVGASWRNRWDSLRLFTPAKYSSLPGLAARAPGHALLGKDEVTDHLRSHAANFELPVVNGVRADRLASDHGRFVVDSGGVGAGTASRAVAG